jgi:uncharacterized protein (DUF488 family)
MKLFTIGFTGKTAENFFSLLASSNASKLIDIRINRTSQLAGFAKEQDLRYFLPRLVDMSYLVREDLAPDKSLLASYRNKSIPWESFQRDYLGLLKSRGVLETLQAEDFANAVLLCSENEPEKCHRTLLSNLIVEKFPLVQVVNLK